LENTAWDRRPLPVIDKVTILVDVGLFIQNMVIKLTLKQREPDDG